MPPLVLLLSFFAASGMGLRITDVTFPSYVMLDQTVTLVCDYRVSEGEYVDSIKWYKDGDEFYRIVPNTPIERDRVVIFDRPGVSLDRQKSGLLKVGMHQVVLQEVNLNSTGRYMCQITESRPPFHTEQRERDLTVIIRPEAPPQIQGLQPEYALHETVDVMCTSARAFPAAKLDFFVNDEPVGDNIITRYPVRHHPGGVLLTASIGLRYQIRAKLLANSRLDELSVKCTAKIGNAYWQSVVEKTRIKRQGRMLELSEGQSNGATHLANLTTTLFLATVMTLWTVVCSRPHPK